MCSSDLMGVGGPARWILSPTCRRNAETMMSALTRHKIPWMVLGKGANTIFSDEGFPGAIIRLKGLLEKFRFQGNSVVAGGGVILHRMVCSAVERGLGGLERLAGFPSTVGGAVMMNAGCYGQSIEAAFDHAILITPEGASRTLLRSEAGFEYRTSSFSERGIIAYTVFQFGAQPVSTLRASMEEVLARRKESLPPGRHAGSVVKNPPGHKAWELIRACGLAGLREGMAEISTVHSNVILNRGSASATDIFTLARRMISEVRDRFGVVLEPEVKFIGFPPLV